jgi:serine/threonine protein kinase
MPIAAGTRFDRYQIISPLGSGGMGEIYLAQDARLNRKVAIKLLPDRYTKDPERLRRFEQEAQAASALNHPNIITIFEIGEAEGRHFIATEYIEGRTLRRRMASGRLTTVEALDIAEQVVDALAAAHAAGIVHRDIKPENIMIRPDGYVKVLDFGLAKLTEKAAATEVSEAEQPDAANSSGEFDTPTTADLDLDEAQARANAVDRSDPLATAHAKSANETAPGVVMGTAQYMSPEQARGLRVDSRTDIFSFGIVFYEMLSGRPPFSGETSRALVAAILNNEPPPLSHFQPEIPEVLEWIAAKALVKDREERYQTAKEMLNDLRRLHRRLDVEQELEKSRSLISPTFDSGADHGPPEAAGHSTRELEMKTGTFSAARSTGSLDDSTFPLLAARIRQNWIVAFVIAMMLIAVVGLYFYQASRTQPHLPFKPMEMRRFTFSGKALRASISPDGKYIAHVLSDAGKQSLQVRQINESNNVTIVDPAEVICRGMTFSHDSSYVYYVVQEQNNPIQVLYQVPVLGGRAPRRILRNVDSPIAISPDNRRFAFVRRHRGQNEDALMVADIDGSNERRIASRSGADFFGTTGLDWSPDGRVIALAAGTNTGGRQMHVAEVSVADGREKPVSSRQWLSVGRVSWMRAGSPESSGLIFTAMEQGSTLSQIWHLPYPSGAPQKITNDLNDYRDMSLSYDDRNLVTVQSEAHVNVWLLPNADTSKAARITDGIGQYNGVRGLTWMPDGRLAYVSRISGSQDIWLMDQQGGNQRQLTTTETRADIYPAVSPDGKYIVFVSTRTGNSNLYRYEVDTGDWLQLTSGPGEEFPAISGDGKWVIYTATGAAKFTLWKVPIEGGEPEQLTRKLSQWPDVSPDGQKIACWYRSDANAKWQIAILPVEGGEAEQVFDVPPTAETPIPIRWMPDGKGISFADTRGGASNIWNQHLDGSQPKQLTFFSADQIFWFEWSRDGKLLATSRGRVMSDVVLMTENGQ